jgi:hypothetical protein
MPFTAEEIQTFIRAQRQELERHCRFLWDVYHAHCTEQEAIDDWVRRYAADYREVGERVLGAICHLDVDRRLVLFKAAMNEIMLHKFIESERARRDVGLKTAGTDWLKYHCSAWLNEKPISSLST